MDAMLDYPWWLVTFAGIGMLAILGGIVTLFFSLGRRPNRMWTEAVEPVASDDFTGPLAALLNVPLRKGGSAHLLNNGDEYFPVILDAIRAAKHSVHVMVYIWEDGRISDEFISTMIEKRKAGVQVRVLLDAFGGMRAPDDKFEKLVEAGGRVEKFRPAVPGKLLRFHRRNHRRAIVIDGRVGFTGGAAVADKWAGSASTTEEWRDTMVRVDGCIAHNLQSAFCELWAFVTGEVLTGEEVFPGDLLDQPDSGVHSCGVISSPSSEEHPLRLFFFLSFLAARERLWITTPYFVPDKHTRQVVKRRAQAGVDVRILMPNHHTDARPIRQASHSYYSELMNAGVRIYEYQPTMMHTKGVVVDGQWSVVGSANMDIRSKELNEENVLGIRDAAFAAELERTFLADLENAREIDRVQWRRRGIGSRIIERICVLFAEQY
ncbi:MAG TPA: phospholipase D-like domain-containing protein [Longimicrobiales bacterium]|nr:phospholipase D-like domain-containing protein [Longimicrobiales bacterium]